MPRNAPDLIRLGLLLVTAGGMVAAGARKHSPAAISRDMDRHAGGAGSSLSTAGGGNTEPPNAGEGGTLYAVATAHLDTQWLWTIQDTIRENIPRTLQENFERFEKYPDYVFNFEGAFRYMLAKEYDPDGYARLRDYVRKGRWRVAGSSIDAGDTNIPAPESLIRHVLYANRFFRHELGTESTDLFLPDCFGFGWALPSVAAHCGLEGFSTQKLTWGSSVGIPFDVGVWEGVDGSTIVAALNPGEYVSTIREDLSRSPEWLARIQKLGRSSGAPVAYRYYGVGDRGGAPDDASVSWLEKSLTGTGPVRVVSAPSGRMYHDLTPAQIGRLPRYRGELLMTRHGTGCYTSQAAMKRWNRRNEQLAAAAERASVAADWLGGAVYPRDDLTAAWIRFLWHHHHDDVTGTSTPLAYPFSWNDEILSMNAFAAVLSDGAGAVARALDTRSQGEAIVVFNPLSFDREDVVEADVRWRGTAAPKAVRIFGPDGRETPSQIVSRLQDPILEGRADPESAAGNAAESVDGSAAEPPGKGRGKLRTRAASEFAGSARDEAGRTSGALRVLFLAHVPSVGFAVYDVRPSDRPCALPTGLSAGTALLESPRYRVSFDANGDVASIRDKANSHEVLAAPARLQLLDDAPDNWPEWELSWADVARAPRAHVAGPARVRVVERGPVRVAVEVSRQAAGSTFTQTIRLAARGAGDTVAFDTRIDWRTPRTLVKAAFPLAVASPKATYDLGLGTIERGNNRDALYEVPAQQWADITASDGRYGVAVLEDCKYGWDKPDDRTLRLSLIHAPLEIEKDRGRHRLEYAVSGHAGDWRAGRVQMLAARLNQPLVALQAPSHAGPLGRRFAMLELSTPQVALSALKNAEDDDEVIVRLFEEYGRPARDVRLTMAAPILAVREVTGQEDPLPTPARTITDGAPRIDNGALRLSFEPYRPRTFALRLAQPGVPPLSPPASRPVRLEYDADVISLDSDRSDGDFDGSGHSLPGELLPEALVSGGIRFELGPKTPGAKNALTCRGQTIELSAEVLDRVYFLAAAAGGDTSGSFTIDGRSVSLAIQEFTGFVGQSQSLVVNGSIVSADTMEEPFLKTDRVAWVGTHRHSAMDGNEPYVFCYLFRYALELPARPSGGTRHLTLPRNEAIRILAVSAATHTNDSVLLASESVDRMVPVRIRPKGGLFVEPVHVTLECARKDAAVHYTLNGREPLLGDPLYTEPLTIEKDATLRARAYLGELPLEDVAVRTFRFTTLRPPSTPLRTASGLSYRCFEGVWRDLAGLSAALPVRSGTAETISLAPRTRDLDFGLDLSGYLEVPRDGVYTFSTRSDDGSSLSIDGALVVDNDGLHGSVERSGQTALAAGKHALRVLFFQRGGDLELEGFWEGPGLPRQPIPPSALFHEE